MAAAPARRGVQLPAGPPANLAAAAPNRSLGVVSSMKRCFAVLPSLALLVCLAPAQDEPKLLEPVNLPFNTDKDEDDPHIASNNLTFFYVTNANKKLEIMSSTRKTAKDPWPVGQLLANIKSKDADFRSPFLTADG